MIVKYVSGANKKTFVLNKGYDLAIKVCNPHASAWTYESAAQQFGEKITSFGKDVLALDIELKVRGTLDGISENLNDFFEECETDVINMTQGALWFDDEYLSGWFIERESVPSQEFYGWEQTITFMAPYPFYIREETGNFYPAGSGSGSQAGLDYNYDHNYDYAADSDGIRSWYIDHYAPSEFKMTIYGPCENPQVNINGYPRQVFTTLEANEYLIVNSRDNTVVKYLANGNTINLYDLRQKTQSIFEKIPSGNLNVAWSAAFGFDITLYVERSEPTWNLS